MKLLIKFPSRQRPDKCLEVLKKYIDFADSKNTIIVSVDEDDPTLPQYIEKLKDLDIILKVGNSRTKIQAINCDIPDPSEFDILLLASDDMIPIQRGYDTIIRDKMQQYFPDTDGVLFFNDGTVNYILNTLVCCGSKYYQRFNYIYYPEYKSFFCDNEFMDTANSLGRQVYFPNPIIKHEHPVYNKKIKSDTLYITNKKYWKHDEELYKNRRNAVFDITVMICTLPTRSEMFARLVNKIVLLQRTSILRIQILHDDTGKEITIGAKRNRLLQRAEGKYCCFVDDDDEITDDYFKVITDSRLNVDCIVLNGIMYLDGVKIKPFYHSIKYYNWWEDETAYYRYPNHWNPILTSIAKQIEYPNISFREDLEYSKRLQNSKLIKTEYKHDTIQYIYYYSTTNKSYKWTKEPRQIRMVGGRFKLI